MKTILLFVFLVSGINLIHSQSLLDKSNVWNIKVTPLVMAPFVEAYRFNKEVEIEGHVYAQLQSSQGNGWIDKSIFFREDQPGRFYVRYGADEEGLIYDFNLQEGDRFREGGACEGIVTSVDSVVLLDGSKRKRIHLNYPGVIGLENEEWIEGIGSSAGLFAIEHLCYSDHPYGLGCFRSGDEVLYAPISGVCEKLNAQQLRYASIPYLSPNPFSATLMINPDSGPVSRIALYSVEGRRLMTMDIGSEPQINIGPGLQPGIYFAHLTTSDGTAIIQKLIRQ